MIRAGPSVPTNTVTASVEVAPPGSGLVTVTGIRWPFCATVVLPVTNKRTAEIYVVGNAVPPNETCAPFHTYVASGPNETRLFRTWHIADDTSCYTFYVHFDYDKPINPEEFYRQFGYRTTPPDYKTAYMVDELHPNTAGYAKMGDTWYAAISAFLH